MRGRLSVILFALISVLLLLVGCTQKEEAPKPDTELNQPAASPDTVSEPADTAAEEEDTLELSAKEEPEPPQACDDPAPAFELVDISGGTASLSDYQGKVLLLDFWATWCGPCRMEIPWFIELQEKYEDKGFIVVGVSLDRSKDILPGYVEKMDINYPILHGFGSEIVRDYGNIRSIPTTFIIDRDGCIKHKLVGVHPKKEFEKLIEPLLETGEEEKEEA